MLHVILCSIVLVFWIVGELFVKLAAILCASAKYCSTIKIQTLSIVQKPCYCSKINNYGYKHFMLILELKALDKAFSRV